MLNLVVLGSGSREYAIIDKLIQDSRDELYYPVSNIYNFPKNDALLHNYPEVSLIPSNHHPLKSDYYNSFIEFCKDNRIDMVIIGPEQHLVDGIVDRLEKHNISAFGPHQLASQLEGSKVFSKSFMDEFGLTTAPYQTFNNISIEDARTFINNNWSESKKYVLKADGLAGGKGVILPDTREECLTEIDNMLLHHKFGTASDSIVIEERLEGTEVSILGFCNGEDIAFMPPTQDYKKKKDNDQGLNTGGMGCHCPVITLTSTELKTLQNQLIPLIKHFKYKGVLYCGLMKSYTDDKIYFLEFNCRFGDPETQVILPLLSSSLYQVMAGCCQGKSFWKIGITWRPGFVSNVILSHQDYPVSKLSSPVPITIPSNNLSNNSSTPTLPFVKTYWANVSINNDTYYTTGGRVCSLVCYHPSDFYQTLFSIYNYAKLFDYPGIYYRRDIGNQFLSYVNTLTRQTQPTKKMNIAVLGSTNGTSLETVLQHYHSKTNTTSPENPISSPENNINVSVIISNRKNAGILKKAQHYGISYLYLPSKKGQSIENYETKMVNILRQYDIDLVLLVGYMKIVSPVLLSEYPNAIFNIHPSLLPKYGNMMDLDVHQQVINNKEYSTGCTLHYVTEEVDSGDILFQRQLTMDNLTSNTIITSSRLKTEVQKLESQCLIDAIYLFYSSSKIDYKSSGVDIDKGNELVENIKSLSESTKKYIGGFGANFEIPLTPEDIENKKIILSAGTDGVGTKLDLAIDAKKYDTIGIDLVAMSVNDLLVGGIRPLFFLDYLAVDSLQPDKCRELVKGVQTGCQLANIPLIGGETAEMKGIYFKDKFDMAGFAVGKLEYPITTPVEENNLIYGIASSGIHSNGYSLVRKLLSKAPFPVHKSKILELLTPTKIYTEALELFEKYPTHITGMAHITGGGFTDNIPRVLPNDLTFELQQWDLPLVFQWIQDTALLSKDEMMRTFNCGYGLVVISTTELNEPYLDLIGKILKK